MSIPYFSYPTVRELVHACFGMAYLAYFFLVHLTLTYSKIPKTQQLKVIIVWHNFNAFIMLNTAKAIELLFTQYFVRKLLIIVKQTESSRT